MTALENQVIKGFTWKLLYAIIFSTTIIVSGGTAAYYGLKAEIKNNAAVQDSKWAVHDVEYKSGIVRLEKVEALSASNEKRITSVESKQNN